MKERTGRKEGCSSCCNWSIKVDLLPQQISAMGIGVRHALGKNPCHFPGLLNNCSIKRKQACLHLPDWGDRFDRHACERWV